MNFGFSISTKLFDKQDNCLTELKSLTIIAFIPLENLFSLIIIFEKEEAKNNHVSMLLKELLAIVI